MPWMKLGEIGRVLTCYFLIWLFLIQKRRTNSVTFCAAISSELPQYFFNPWKPESDMSIGYALNEIGRDWTSSDQLILIFAVEKIRRTPLFTWFNRFLLSIRSNDLFYWRKTSNTVQNKLTKSIRTAEQRRTDSRFLCLYLIWISIYVAGPLSKIHVSILPQKTLSESREWELFKKSGIIKIGSRSSENHWKQNSGQEFEHFDGFLYRKADLKAWRCTKRCVIFPEAHRVAWGSLRASGNVPDPQNMVSSSN